jgi:hypothetical protein
MPKIRVSMPELQRRALLEVRKQPGCHNVQEIAINRVAKHAENNWSLCVLAAGAADANTAARAAVHVQTVLRRDYDLLTDWSVGPQEEGRDQMDNRFSFSVFTVEINGRPTLALQAKRYKDAERLCEQGRLRTELSTMTSHGTPLCDERAAMKIRLATAEEAVLYWQATQSSVPSSDTNAVYLVELDE